MLDATTNNQIAIEPCSSPPTVPVLERMKLHVDRRLYSIPRVLNWRSCLESHSLGCKLLIRFTSIFQHNPHSEDHACFISHGCSSVVCSAPAVPVTFNYHRVPCFNVPESGSVFMCVFQLSPWQSKYPQAQSSDSDQGQTLLGGCVRTCACTFVCVCIHNLHHSPPRCVSLWKLKGEDSFTGVTKQTVVTTQCCPPATKKNAQLFSSRMGCSALPRSVCGWACIYPATHTCLSLVDLCCQPDLVFLAAHKGNLQGGQPHHTQGSVSDLITLYYS